MSGDISCVSSIAHKDPSKTNCTQRHSKCKLCPCYPTQHQVNCNCKCHRSCDCHNCTNKITDLDEFFGGEVFSEETVARFFGRDMHS